MSNISFYLNSSLEMTEKDKLLEEIIRMKQKEEKLKRKLPDQQMEDGSNNESFQDLVCSR